MANPRRTRPGEMMAANVPQRWVGPKPFGPQTMANVPRSDSQMPLFSQGLNAPGVDGNVYGTISQPYGEPFEFERQKGFQGPFPAQPVGTYPNLGANPYINPNVPPASYPGSFAPTDLLMRLQGYLRGWFVATNTLRDKMKRDYEYALGNGSQWKATDRQKVEASGRPALEFNHILPQIEAVCGIHRTMQIDYKALPRNHRDARMAEIATAALKATEDFTRISRTNAKVFDDATIVGMGVWEIIHAIEDAEDLIWGDILVSRINPMAFIWDPWSATYDLQDGFYMGKAIWMNIDAFRDRYPDFKYTSIPGEWLAGHGLYGGDSTDLGTPQNLLQELYDQQAGRIRHLTMWYKVPMEVAFIVNTDTGQVQEVYDKDSGEQMLSDLAARLGREAIAPYTLMSSDMESVVVNRQTGQPVPHPMTGAPMVYADAPKAQEALDGLSKQAGMGVYDTNRVITRKVEVPYFSEMVWWTILRTGRSPFIDRRFPFIPYISRRYTDDPESIFGLARPLEDPQDEINKRHSNFLAISNSSSMSGWLNRKSGGADTQQLERLGSKPGIVVEYGAVPPVQIQPVQPSTAHQYLMQWAQSTVNMIAGTGTVTTPDDKKKSKSSTNQPIPVAMRTRFQTYEEASLDVAKTLLSRIQQYYPPEKLKRIIEVSELNGPLGKAGTPLFTDPSTGQPAPDQHILQELGQFRNFQYDLILSIAPSTATERQVKFEQTIQLLGLLTSTGAQIGANTIKALLQMMLLPPEVEAAIIRDMDAAAQQAQQIQQMQESAGIPPGTPTRAVIRNRGDRPDISTQGEGMGQGGPSQNDQLQRLIANIRGGRAGGGTTSYET